MTYPAKRKFLVIGSNSFSGNDFVDHALNDSENEVVGISRSAEYSPLFLAYKTNKNLANYRFHQMDLNKDLTKIMELVNSYKPDYIVNFAAQSEVAPSWENPQHWYQTNVVSIGLLAHQLKDCKFLKRYVHISSPEVYGSCKGNVTEDAKLNPSTPYAASKAGGDLALLSYVKNFDFPLVTIRATNVYGARQQLFKIIPRTAIYVKSGKTIELHGGGVAVKSYINIRDVSRGEYMAALQGRTGELYHFSPDQGIAVRDVVSKLCRMLGANFETATREVAERLGQDAAYVIDSTKARAEFGWKPEVTIDQGLEQVVSWVNSNWSEIQKQPLGYVHRQ